MKKLLAIAIIAPLMFSGCASQKNWGSMGGSKSDGTVKLGYTYGMFEVPETNAAQAQQKAVQRCQSWGYQSAQSFDFQDRKCQRYDASMGCVQTLVTQEFQCLGTKP